MTNTNSPPVITDASVNISWAPDGGSTTGRYFGYSTVLVVKSRFGAAAAQANNLTSLTPDNIHPIGEAITWTSIDLQLLINHVYAMPYTGSDATILGTLSDLNAKLAMAWLIERMYISNEPNLSPLAAQLRTEVGNWVADLKDGNVVWYPPYGDATPQAMAPVYDLAKGAQMWPPDASNDPSGANASYFTMGRTWYRRGSTM